MSPRIHASSLSRLLEHLHGLAPVGPCCVNLGLPFPGQGIEGSERPGKHPRESMAMPAPACRTSVS